MEMRAEVTVQVPASEAWALVGEQFGRIDTWASPIMASFLDRPPRQGAVRTCHVRGFGPLPLGVIRERLLSYDRVRDIIDRVLRRHEPYPGWLVGPGMQFLAANTGADALKAW